MQMLIHLLVTAALLFVVGRMVSGIDVRHGRAALFGAVALGLANAFIRPILLWLTIPITILTLGLFIWVVNALMLMLAGAVVDGFEVEDFGAALKGSLLLWLLNFAVAALFGIG